MNTGRMKKALLGVGAALLVALALVTTSPTSASAFDGGSGGGSGSGGGGGGLPQDWRWVYSNSLDGLRKAPGIGAHGGAESYVRKSSGGQALWDNYCMSPNLVRVYWIQNSQYAVSMTSGGLAQPWNNPAGGDSIDQYAGTQLNHRGTYVICVVNAVERITKTEPQTRPRADATTIGGIVAWNTSITPALNAHYDGIDPIGADNLNHQMGTKESNFGRIVREIAKSGRGDYLHKLGELQDAISHDTSEQHAAVELNEDNQAGIAEGGVLNIQEHTVRQQVALNMNWSESRSRRYTCDYKPGTNGTELASPANCTYEDWSGWSEDRDSRTHNISPALGTPENTAFWQILSVHCNPEELGAALSAYGISGVDYNVVSQTRTDEGVTTIVHTKAVKSAPHTRDGKVFGSKAVDNAALKRTADKAFYDKHCSIQCLADPAGAGASDKNGATKNTGTSSNRSDGYGKGGAVYGDSNANYFEMFRDNDPRRVAVNMSYPKVEGTAFDYDGSAPIATTVSLWHGSTPKAFLDPKTGGGLLTVNAVNGSGSTKLFTGSVAPTTQTNFTDPKRVQSFSGPWATKLAGPYRNFDISATWASEAKGPAVLNVKWEYQPTTQVTYPSTVGVNSDGSASVATSTRSQKIDVDCYAVFGSNDSAPAQYDAALYTGSDSSNKIDGDILDAAMADGAAAANNEHNLVIRFVRGVAE